MTTLMKLFGIFFLISSIIQIVHGQERVLVIASGGGVAGTANVYKIDANGVVTKGSGLTEITYTGESKLSNCATKKYFRKVKSLTNAYPDFNHPGNMYTSISLMEPDNEMKITWGAPDHQVPEDVKKFHQKIIARLTRLTFAPDPRK